MPIRSILLKLALPRSSAPDASLARQALWCTHAEVNAATAYYQRALLLLRGAGFQTAATTLDDASAQRALLAQARRSQTDNLTRNGIAGTTIPPGDDQAVVNLLTELYAAIVPSMTGDGGRAQDANAYLSPLTDPMSQGFADAARKLARPRPDWLVLVGHDDAAALRAANAWLASGAAESWRSDTGRPAGWLRMGYAGDPAWPRRFAHKLHSLQRQLNHGSPGLVDRLRRLHLLPLLPAYFAGRIAATDAAVTRWDRLAFRLAVSHLLAWESLCRRQADAHTRRAALLTRFRAEHLVDGVHAGLAAVQRFEQHRAELLSHLAHGIVHYRLLRRQLRNWPELRQQWLRTGSSDPAALMRIAKREQARLRGRFGDPAVFAWLAAPDNQAIWRAEPDVVSLLASLNALEAQLAGSRPTALMTFADAVVHPRAVQWSAPGDRNLPPYRLAVTAQGACSVRLRLLARHDADGPLVEHERTVPLARSTQFRNPALSLRGQRPAARFQAAGVDTWSGLACSADLLFDRHRLARRGAPTMAGGDIGPVWLKLSLDLDVALRAGRTADTSRLVRHFQTAAGKPTRHEPWVVAGARVLSVDLGVRRFAACSVFSLVDAPPTDGHLAFPVEVGGRSWQAVHERSFHLTLPGDLAGGAGDRWRDQQTQWLQRLRRALGRYRWLTRLSALTAADRLAALRDFATAVATADWFPFEAELAADLVARTAAPEPVWAGAVAAGLARFKAELGVLIKAWRRAGRARAGHRRAGPSMWAIQHLTDIRRLLLGWSLLRRRSGYARRARAGFAARLLAHINAIKRNRVKVGADLIVQAARGYQRDPAGRWRQCHPACDLILFEDLSGFRMAAARPRWENAQLGRWAHRTIPAQVAMQAEVYGLAVTDTAAAFSSRYHARSLTPGIRCRSLAKADFRSSFLRERLAADGLALATLRPGDLVPWRGGAVFVCQRPGGGLRRIDADINAAQNLQRRFWTRHGEAFRIPCRAGEVGGQPVYLPRGMGRRLVGAMGGPGMLTAVDADRSVWRWQPMTWAQLHGLGVAFDGGAERRDAAADADADALQSLADRSAALSGKLAVLFRDPSGVVWPNDYWVPQTVFWRTVKARLVAALLADVGDIGQSS